MSLLKQGVQNCRAVRTALHRAVCGLETTSWAAAGSRSSAMALELEPGFQTWPVMAAMSRGRSSLTKLNLNLSPWPIVVFLSPLDERTKATLFASLELWKTVVLTAPQANWVYSFCLLNKQQKPKALPEHNLVLWDTKWGAVDQLHWVGASCCSEDLSGSAHWTEK